MNRNRKYLVDLELSETQFIVKQAKICFTVGDCRRVKLSGVFHLIGAPMTDIETIAVSRRICVLADEGHHVDQVAYMFTLSTNNVSKALTFGSKIHSQKQMCYTRGSS